MYRHAEEKITEGLSLPARLVLALFAGGFGVLMILVAPPTANAPFFYFFGGFCLLVCLACATWGRVRQFVGSLVGVVLFAASLVYIASQIIGGGPLVSERSGQSIFNSILFLVFFGLPGIGYAIRAKFGWRGKATGSGPSS